MTQSVVDLSEVGPGVVKLSMQDRVQKNTFSKSLNRDLIQSFKHIQENSNYKVVVLTGYDSYFACGGTKEDLMAIHNGNMKCTDPNIYNLVLNCKIPVISAMQGHGIGGGFVFGLFADFIILSRKSIYTTNFMNYGFTPGMGATYIVPKKLGFSLGEELLITGNKYYGSDLEKRGIPFPVLPRNQVLCYAYELAQKIAEKPRKALITLKDHLVASIRDELPKVIEQELAMHEKTFHQIEVKNKIEELFGR